MINHNYVYAKQCLDNLLYNIILLCIYIKINCTRS